MAGPNMSQPKAGPGSGRHGSENPTDLNMHRSFGRRMLKVLGDWNQYQTRQNMMAGLMQMTHEQHGEQPTSTRPLQS